MLKKLLIHQFFRDRLMIIMSIFCCLIGLIIIITSLIQLKPSDIQIPVRFSSYGLTNLYREKWYYLLNFTLLGLVLFTQPLVAAKIMQLRGRTFAAGFMGLTLLIGGVALIICWAVFRLASYSV